MATKRQWRAWPTRKLGWASLIMMAISFVMAVGLAVFVNVIRNVDAPESVGFNVGLIFMVIALVAVILGWVAFIFLKDGGIVFLVILSLFTAMGLFLIIGEFIEVWMMSQ